MKVPVHEDCGDKQVLSVSHTNHHIFLATICETFLLDQRLSIIHEIHQHRRHKKYTLPLFATDQYFNWLEYKPHTNNICKCLPFSLSGVGHRSKYKSFCTISNENILCIDFIHANTTSSLSSCKQLSFRCNYTHFVKSYPRGNSKYPALTK